MKVNDQRQDTAKIEQGAWVDNIPDWGDLRLKVRGQNNKDWRRMQAKLVDAVPRAKKVGGRIDPEEMDRITGILLANTCLQDWGNVEDQDGKPIPYTKERAQEFLTDPAWSKFREAVIWASSMVGEVSEVRAEEAAKN